MQDRGDAGVLALLAPLLVGLGVRRRRASSRRPRPRRRCRRRRRTRRCPPGRVERPAGPRRRRPAGSTAPASGRRPPSRPGSGRAEVNSSEPSGSPGRRGLPGRAAGQPPRRPLARPGRPPTAPTATSSSPRRGSATETASRVPSADRARPPSRGSATKSASRWNGLGAAWTACRQGGLAHRRLSLARAGGRAHRSERTWARAAGSGPGRPGRTVPLSCRVRSAAQSSFRDERRGAAGARPAVSARVCNPHRACGGCTRLAGSASAHSRPDGPRSAGSQLARRALSQRAPVSAQISGATSRGRELSRRRAAAHGRARIGAASSGSAPRRRR